MKLKIAVAAGFIILAFCASSIINTNSSATDRDLLSSGEISLVQTMLEKLQPYIDQRKQNGDVNMMTFEELYAQVDPHEKAFLAEFTKIKRVPEEKLNPTIPRSSFIAISNQILQIPNPANPGKYFISTIERQYLPKNVFDAYETMMKSMEKDLGKYLMIESGYRSPAYQLYLFVFYLQNHDYSIKETNRWVALPGTSEHGDPSRQAIDFINQEGISGENHPEDFEELDEYEWLTQKASGFGFVLSYPRNNPTNSAFEPWHWRFDPETAKNLTAQGNA